MEKKLRKRKIMSTHKTKVNVSKGGKVSYERSVVTQIIELACKEIAGVASFAVGVKSTVRGMVSKKFKKGIYLNFTEEGIETTVYLNTLFGHSVSDVAYRVQENIKKSVESMTEYKMKKINVIIVGVSFQVEESAYV